MKKQTLVLIIFLSSFLALDAQNSYIKGRWNIKAGFASYPSLAVISHGFKQSDADLRIETNYGLLNFLEIGGYLGCGQDIIVWEIEPGSYQSTMLYVPDFGLDINLQLLPFIIKGQDFRFDLYLLGRYGGAYYSSPQNYIPEKGFHFQYSHGGGIAFYLTKHIGIFSEFSFTALDIKGGNLRYGLSVKF